MIFSSFYNLEFKVNLNTSKKLLKIKTKQQKHLKKATSGQRHTMTIFTFHSLLDLNRGFLLRCSYCKDTNIHEFKNHKENALVSYGVRISGRACIHVSCLVFLLLVTELLACVLWVFSVQHLCCLESAQWCECSLKLSVGRTAERPLLNTAVKPCRRRRSVPLLAVWGSSEIRARASRRTKSMQMPTCRHRAALSIPG